MALAAFVVSACSDTQVGSRYVKSVHVSAAQGAVISIQASDDAALAGTLLGIPPNSLAADTIITLERGAADLVAAPDQVSGPVAVWGPAGTLLSLSAQLTLPYALPAGATASELFVQVQDSTATPSTVEAAGLTLQASPPLVTFALGSLASYQPGTHPGCRSTLDCPSNEFCINGICQSGNSDAGPFPDAGPTFDAGPISDAGAPDSGCDCRTTNCSPPNGLCRVGAVLCDSTTGGWYCAVDGGSPDGG